VLGVVFIVTVLGAAESWAWRRAGVRNRGDGMSEPRSASSSSRVFDDLRAVDEASLSVAAATARADRRTVPARPLFSCIAGTLRDLRPRAAVGKDISTLAENRRTALGMGARSRSPTCSDLTVFENLMLSIIGTSRRKWIMHRPVLIRRGTRRCSTAWPRSA
jgi:hypothetical protein